MDKTNINTSANGILPTVDIDSSGLPNDPPR